ncbi:SusC/RagA family TonB-linked outer membrane protein [Dysgonomonas sp. ZJ279]|uniref:SusC/RagA family TonB-linked outer membrane protein n=1 Tax=Dysgonomonas sp. ZJ279 TaxID=2709796 RepID=UPI0013EC0AB7|nr:TonB-dependent receptor [Dysgonomonas sp. ZJ279]
MRNAFSSLVRRKSIHSKCLIAMLAVGSCSVAASPSIYAKSEMGVYEDMQQQTKTVVGTVSDEIGEPLYGVSVRVKGTTVGTITDLDGKFTLQVPTGNSVLQFSYISYLSQEVNVANQTNVTIVLKEDSQMLDDIVVVGYGVQRKSDVVGSIGVATGEQLLQLPANNALEGLKGRVAGVAIFNTTGNPLGDKGPRVLIRGVNSINTETNPLYVVDGVQMADIQFLNPNDIERMEVLKDASATAIYGARGANGVILVTTKRGTTGKKGTVVSYAGWLTVSTLFKEIDVMNSAEFMEVQRIGRANIPYFDSSKTAQVPDTSNKDLFDSNGNPLYDTNWQREATRDAFSHSHQVNIQSQGDKSSVGAFFNFTDQQGQLINNYAKRLNAKLTYDTDVNKWLSFNTNLMINHVWGNSVEDFGGGQDARRTMLEMPPIFPVKYPDGTYSNSSGTNLGLESMPSPVHELTEVKRNRYKTKIFGNLAATFHILPGLDLRTQIGVDANFRQFKLYQGTDLINMSAGSSGRAFINREDHLFWQEETYLTYIKTINKVHRINGTLGMAWSQNTTDSNNSGDVRYFPDDFFGYNNLEAGSQPSSPTSGWSRWSMHSYFARGSYAFKDRYLATATVRVDGSSRFGGNNKYATFPSLGLGWIITEEDFMKEASWISNLKLRASYGSTGNTEIDTYRSQAPLISSTLLLGGVRSPYNYLERFPNPDLKWERTNQFDVGVDFGLFNNRINVEASYYYKQTKDLLLERPIPYTTGYGVVWDNIGQVDNQGVDLMINTTNIESKDFRWETTFNMNYNKNEIKKLGVNNEDIFMDPNFLSGNIILRVGESLGTFWGYERLGTYSSDEGAAEAARAAAKGESPSFVAGEAKRSADKKILGKGMPEITGSLINHFYYKNFDFTVDLQFVSGADVRQNFFHSLEDRTGLTNTLSTTLYDAWTETNQNTMIQRIRHAAVSGQSSQSDSHWVANGAYIRGNLLQLGYTVSPGALKKTGLSSLRINASVKNAFVICSSDFKGYDPESTSYDNKFGQNTFFFQYPTSRVYSLGVNLSF